MGRFMTPDWAARATAVPYAVFGDPQSLNLYSYVRNDPVTNVDPDGHDCTAQNTVTNPSTKTCVKGGATTNFGTPPKQSESEAKKDQQSLQHGLTVGAGVTGNIDVGVGKAGAETNASVVSTLSISSKGKPSIGIAASGGAVAYVGKHVAAAPKQETGPLVAGAYAGGGVTFIVASVALSFDHHGTFGRVAQPFADFAKAGVVLIRCSRVPHVSRLSKRGIPRSHPLSDLL